MQDGKAESKLSDDLLWGVSAIANEIGETYWQTYNKLVTKQLPAGKSGNQWIGSRSVLRKHQSALRKHFQKVTSGNAA